MNKRAVSELAGSNLIYFIIGVLFFALMFYWIVGLQDGAVAYEDFYAKEIARLIDSSRPGDELYLDVTPAAIVALKRGVNVNDMFNLNSQDKSIFVQLYRQGGTKFEYMTDKNIENFRITNFPTTGETKLYIKIGERI